MEGRQSPKRNVCTIRVEQDIIKLVLPFTMQSKHIIQFEQSPAENIKRLIEKMNRQYNTHLEPDNYAFGYILKVPDGEACRFGFLLGVGRVSDHEYIRHCLAHEEEPFLYLLPIYCVPHVASLLHGHQPRVPESPLLTSPSSTSNQQERRSPSPPSGRRASKTSVTFESVAEHHASRSRSPPIERGNRARSASIHSRSESPTLKKSRVAFDEKQDELCQEFIGQCAQFDLCIRIAMQKVAAMVEVLDKRVSECNVNIYAIASVLGRRRMKGLGMSEAARHESNRDVARLQSDLRAKGAECDKIKKKEAYWANRCFELEDELRQVQPGFQPISSAREMALRAPPSRTDKSCSPAVSGHADFAEKLLEGKLEIQNTLNDLDRRLNALQSGFESDSDFAIANGVKSLTVQLNRLLQFAEGAFTSLSQRVKFVHENALACAKTMWERSIGARDQIEKLRAENISLFEERQHQIEVAVALESHRLHATIGTLETELNAKNVIITSLREMGIDIYQKPKAGDAYKAYLASRNDKQNGHLAYLSSPNMRRVAASEGPARKRRVNQDRGRAPSPDDNYSQRDNFEETRWGARHHFSPVRHSAISPEGPTETSSFTTLSSSPAEEVLENYRRSKSQPPEAATPNSVISTPQRRHAHHAFTPVTKKVLTGRSSSTLEYPLNILTYNPNAYKKQSPAR